MAHYWNRQPPQTFALTWRFSSIAPPATGRPGTQLTPNMNKYGAYEYIHIYIYVYIFIYIYLFIYYIWYSIIFCYIRSYYILGADPSPFRFTPTWLHSFWTYHNAKTSGYPLCWYGRLKAIWGHFHQTIAINLLSWSHLTWIVILEVMQVNIRHSYTQTLPNT